MDTTETETKTKRKLPPFYESTKRKKFALAVLNSMETGVGTAADDYRIAGYASPTRAIAKANACTLKKHPEVQAIIKSYKEELFAKLNPEVRAAQLASIALSDDKRASLAALQEANRVFDEYPAGKLKVQQFNEELEKLQDD
jgi:phage terminase small subunit